MPPASLPALLAVFRDADRMNRSAGDRLNEHVRAIETARSVALENLVHAVTCPTCGMASAGCTGQVAYEVPLWGLDRELPMHRARIRAVNLAARETDGGPDAIIRSSVGL